MTLLSPPLRAGFSRGPTSAQVLEGSIFSVFPEPAFNRLLFLGNR